MKPTVSSSKQTSVDKSIEWGEAVKGIRSRIWLDEKESDLKKRILVHYQMQNTTDIDATIWQSGFWPNNTIIVMDAERKPVRLTKKGKEYLSYFDPAGERIKNYPMNLKPKEIVNINELDLRTLFVFDLLGEYFIQYVYDDYQDGGLHLKLVSNELKIQIK